MWVSYRWSSGLMLHGTLVDGARAALLLPLGFSVLRCQPVTRCSLVDTAFLLLATVTSLNLLTAALSDAPLLPPPVLVPTLLQSAGYTRSQNRYASPLYPKGAGATSYYSVIIIKTFHLHFIFYFPFLSIFLSISNSYTLSLSIVTLILLQRLLYIRV